MLLTCFEIFFGKLYRVKVTWFSVKSVSRVLRRLLMLKIGRHNDWGLDCNSQDNLRDPIDLIENWEPKLQIKIIETKSVIKDLNLKKK